MLPKPSRLNLKKDFKRVVSGKRLETKYLKVFIKEGDPSTPSVSSLPVSLGPRIGIAVSSKSFKKAGKRNRARRLTSAAFEALYLRLPKSLNIVVLPKQSIVDVKSNTVLFDLEDKLKEAGILE